MNSVNICYHFGRNKMICILLMYLLPFCACHSSQPVFAINFNSQLEPCSDESSQFINTELVNVERFNETNAYMYGDIKFLKDIGADTMVELILEKEASGKYEIMFSHEMCDLCGEIAKGTDSEYYDYLKHFGVPDSCPMAADKYPINEFIINTKGMPINSNTCGRYVLYLNFYKNPEKNCKATKEFIFCLTMNLIIEKVD